MKNIPMMSVLIGKNGIGKTTVLNTIVQTYSQKKN